MKSTLVRSPQDRIFCLKSKKKRMPYKLTVNSDSKLDYMKNQEFKKILTL